MSPKIYQKKMFSYFISPIEMWVNCESIFFIANAHCWTLKNAVNFCWIFKAQISLWIRSKQCWTTKWFAQFLVMFSCCGPKFSFLFNWFYVLLLDYSSFLKTRYFIVYFSVYLNTWRYIFPRYLLLLALINFLPHSNNYYTLSLAPDLPIYRVSIHVYL